jgi:hypothetical protein
MVVISELVLLGIVFFMVFHLTDPKAKEVKSSVPPRWSADVLDKKVHKYRVHGVDRNVSYELQNELVRRGVPVGQIPQFDQGPPKEEIAAQLELLMETVPYVSTRLGEPGEDGSSAKSTTELWPRRPELQEQDDM